MAKISKKTATQIAELVNTVSVWGHMVSDGVKEVPMKKQDVDNAMKWHDDALVNLSKILGVRVSATYNQSRMSEMIGA